MARLQRCRAAARLLSEQHERRLGLFERAGLRWHLWQCTGCTNYARQLALMEAATAAWRRPAADPSSDAPSASER